MRGRFRLDTTIAIDLLAGATAVQERIEKAAEIFLSRIVLGELYFGARKSQRVSENLKRIDRLSTQSAVLVCGANTAREYGVIKHALKMKGRPIPENDIWTAALAKEHRLILATQDSHFSEIKDVTVEIW